LSPTPQKNYKLSTKITKLLPTPTENFKKIP